MRRTAALQTAAASLEFWASHGRRHFREEEEEILLPAKAALPPLIEAALPASDAEALAEASS
jgi:hypothetical protein